MLSGDQGYACLEFWGIRGLFRILHQRKLNNESCKAADRRLSPPDPDLAEKEELLMTDYELLMLLLTIAILVVGVIDVTRK